MQNRKLFLAVSIPFVTLIILTAVYTSVRLNRLQNMMDRQQELLLSETESYRGTDDYLQQMSELLSSDLNQLRVSLGLDMKSYPDYPSDSDESMDIPPAAVSKEFYEGISVLIEAESANRKSALLGTFANSSTVRQLLDDSNITAVKGPGLSFLFEKDGAEIARLTAPSESEFLLTSFNGSSMKTASVSNESAAFIRKALEDYMQYQKEKSRLSELLRIAASDERVREICSDVIRVSLERDSVLLFTVKKNSLSLRVSLTDEDYTPVLTVPGKGVFTDYGIFIEALASRLAELDLRDEDDILLDAPKEKISSLYLDPEYGGYLESLGLSLSSEVREDNDYIYYDILRNDGTKLGSFSILKKLGEIYLVDSDEVPVTSLRTLTMSSDSGILNSKTLVIPENIPRMDTLYSGEDTINILLVGSHEKNTDTMILAHADRRTGDACLIGIPRDIYWKGRKINSIYQDFGADRLLKELSEITGLEINNYIKVDMYAFIDIVNILDGIEVTLEEDLVDPSYRTRENGEWKTLNYSSGTYNLNGVEALRIARSRHGSNDFDRSHRQQLILEAFLDKFSKLRITDIDKVYSLINLISQYVETDLSVMELMSIYNNFGDSSLSGKYVLSFDNILYATYSNTYLLDDDFVPGPDYNKGAWILLPEGDDWNNIRWYVRRLINGDPPVE